MVPTRTYEPNKLTKTLVAALKDAINALEVRIYIDEIEGECILGTERMVKEYKSLLERINTEHMDLRMSSRDE